MTVQDRVLVKECIEYLESKNLINILCDEFYKNIFEIEPKLKILIPNNQADLNRKFFSMLATFKAVKHLEKISKAIIDMGARHKQYGITDNYLLSMKTSLIKSLNKVMKEDFDKYKYAWENTYSEVSELLKKGAKESIINKNTLLIDRVKNIPNNFIDILGGEEVITRVHIKFYDDIFEDTWLGQFFGGKDKKALVKRQTEFMIMCFGGKSEYFGETPPLAHMHMYLTEEMILARELILKKAIISEGISEELCEKWIEVDHFFGVGLIKNSIDDCVLKCFGQAPLVAKKPIDYKVSSI